MASKFKVDDIIYDPTYKKISLLVVIADSDNESFIGMYKLKTLKGKITFFKNKTIVDNRYVLASESAKVLYGESNEQ